MTEDLRQATPDEIDSDDMCIVVASRLIGQNVGFWFTTDGNSVFVQAYKSLADTDPIVLTLDNVDDFLATRRAERIARQLHTDAN